MADVYLGIHDSLQRPVAVKILHSHLVEDQEVRRRFHAEAKAVSGLRHPNIVQVHDFGLLDGRPYIIMEYVDGPSLADFLHMRGQSARPMPMDQLVALVVQVASALDYAHSRGIVHRDVKPANILLRGVGHHPGDGKAASEPREAVLSDFGVARFAQSTAATLSGTILGTPAYMAPEQVMGGAIDARIDIYSLGVVLYELLTGGLPFQAAAETPAAMLFQHVHEAPPALPDQVAGLQVVIDRALAKDPGERYLTAGDLADELRLRLSGGPALMTGIRRNRATRKLAIEAPRAVEGSRKRRTAWLGIIALLALLLAGGMVSLPRLLPGLVEVGAPGVSSLSPTPTPSHVGNDPASATALAASFGASPTSVGAPGSTNTAGPGQTTVATSPASRTPTPSPTSSPRPSATRQPTSTPQPTATPPPTSTPTPPPTATPTECLLGLLCIG